MTYSLSYRFQVDSSVNKRRNIGFTRLVAAALEEIREFTGFEKKPEAKRKREEMEI